MKKSLLAYSIQSIAKQILGKVEPVKSPIILFNPSAKQFQVIPTSLDNACKADTDISSDNQTVEVLKVQKMEKVRIWLLIVNLQPPSIVITGEAGMSHIIVLF